MINTIANVFTGALVVTGVGIALRPGAPTASVLSSLFGGFAKVQTAAFGPGETLDSGQTHRTFH